MSLTKFIIRFNQCVGDVGPYSSVVYCQWHSLIEHRELYRGRRDHQTVVEPVVIRSEVETRRNKTVNLRK